VTPTLIVWGEKDENTYTPPSDAEILHVSIKNSVIAMLPGAFHYSFLDKPVEFQSALRPFFAKLYGEN
jgi:pimeloyl-ACP methyl ester carboxylesterase